MTFIEEMKKGARREIKTIVLPETTDIRVLEAAHMVQEEGFGNIILIGNEEEILKLAYENKIDISGAKIIDPEKSGKKEEYIYNLYELRKHKGLTIEEAKKLILDPVYYGMMMVKLDEADGLVSRSCAFNSRYSKTSTSNIENST